MKKTAMPYPCPGSEIMAKTTSREFGIAEGGKYIYIGNVFDDATVCDIGDVSGVTIRTVPKKCFFEFYPRI